MTAPVKQDSSMFIGLTAAATCSLRRPLTDGFLHCSVPLCPGFVREDLAPAWDRARLRHSREPEDHIAIMLERDLSRLARAGRLRRYDFRNHKRDLFLERIQAWRQDVRDLGNGASARFLPCTAAASAVALWELVRIRGFCLFRVRAGATEQD